MAGVRIGRGQPGVGSRVRVFNFVLLCEGGGEGEGAHFLRGKGVPNQKICLSLHSVLGFPETGAGAN